MEQYEINITCSDQFYLDQSFLKCNPECGVWFPYSSFTVAVIDGTFIAGNVLGVLLCTAVLITSFIKRKRMYVCVEGLLMII